MSHPHATAPKRPFSSTPTTSSSSPTSPAPPHMKKAKLPAASSSSGPTEKNGLRLDPAVAAVAARGGGRTNDEEDAEMVLADQDLLPDLSASAPSGVAANLFRKKATLPQPSAAATRKPLRIKIGQPKLPTNFEEDTWAILKDAITAIFLKQKLSCDVEKLYQAAGDLVYTS